MGLLICTRCSMEKPADLKHFPPHNKKSNGLDSWCRECRNNYRKEFRLPLGINDKEKGLEARALTECIICGVETSVVVDHDHSTGDVRGGLCTNCNLGIGHFKDNPELLRFAALYLEGKCACGSCEVYWGGNQQDAGY